MSINQRLKTHHIHVESNITLFKYIIKTILFYIFWNKWVSVSCQAHGVSIKHHIRVVYTENNFKSCFQKIPIESN